MKKTLRAYQIQDLARMIGEPRLIHRGEPATGKTAPCCAMAQYVFEYEGGATLFLQPKSIIRKNRQEMLDCTSCFDIDDVIIFDPQKIHKLRKPPTVILTTADTLVRHWASIQAIASRPIKLCLADESHLYFSSDKAKRTQFWYSAMDKIPRLIAMTGTPIRGRMDSIYPAIHMIEPRYYGSQKNFINYHALMSFEGKIIGWTNHLKLGRILNQHAINRTFKECYGEEKKLLLPVTLEMSAQHRKFYDQFHEMAVLELDNDDVLTATNEAVAVMRARQIIAHPESIGIEGWKDEVLPKDQWILEEVVPNYNSALIFCTLVKEQERLKNLLEAEGLRVGLINGSVSLSRRAEIDRMFQAGELDFIVASPATAGVGFNWQRAECVIFVSCDYMDDNIVQAYRRAIRGVRDTTLPIYILRYAKTVEKRILQILETKSALAAKIDPTREALAGLYTDEDFYDDV